METVFPCSVSLSRFFFRFSFFYSYYIFIDNSINILKVLDNFSNNLEELKKAIKEKDKDKLFKIFSSTKEIRREIIKAGQDTEKPDFGRKKTN